MKRLSLLFFSCACLATVVRAQKAATIHVSFTMENTSTGRGLKAPARAALEANVCQAFSDTIQKKFPYWTAQPVAAGSADTPLLGVELIGGSVWVLRVTLHGVQNAPVTNGQWEVTIFEPGDYRSFGNLLTPETWPEFLNKRFSAVLDRNKYEIAIRDAMSANVPIGHEVSLKDPLPSPPNPEYLIVLPLDWGTYAQLGVSEFTIVCLSNTSGQVKLHSSGMGRSEEFMPLNRPRFQGLVVQIRDWEVPPAKRSSIDSHKADLAQLKPLAVYLTNIVNMDVEVAQ